MTNTPNLPEWALPIRDAMVEKMKGVRAWDGDTLAHNLTRDELTDAATAALAEALPMVVEHFAGVLEAKAGSLENTLTKVLSRPSGLRDSDVKEFRGKAETLRGGATAIRREVGL